MLNHLKNLDLLVYKSTREEAIKTTKIPKFAFVIILDFKRLQFIPDFRIFILKWCKFRMDVIVIVSCEFVYGAESKLMRRLREIEK